ncbi:Ig-like domain-containing protein [Ectobacillus antri]|uniref:Ig-like domain-containing protein n=1 Tax=Ectobacillus antri TaxID=2486280 RepID=A0ABT6H3A4_9BACI|nr:Ig-like domain-containing protein [Ectobacillus antri]MDG4658060.1 Ig-like domain-containing protein [Ectobacillus antri]MDG5753699.1 Ig-like domain-containing protein [Ectobacillus antri]
MDAPDATETISGNYTVSGWFLDRAGVGRVEVLIDGAMVGNAVYGQPRFDVQQVYPQYNNLNAGYRFVLDTKKFSNGNHTLTIRERGKSNRVVTLSNVPIVIANH